MYGDRWGIDNAAFVWYPIKTTGIIVYICEITEIQSGQLCKGNLFAINQLQLRIK